LFRNLL